MIRIGESGQPASYQLLTFCLNEPAFCVTALPLVSIYEQKYLFIGHVGLGQNEFLRNMYLEAVRPRKAVSSTKKKN